MLPKMIRMADLKERGIVDSHQTLSIRIEKQGFPPGRLLGPNTRAWTEDEVAQWLDSRPQPIPSEPDVKRSRGRPRKVAAGA